MPTPYIAPPRYQLDGSPYQGLNCVPTTDAMLLERSSLGGIAVSGAHIRAQSGDTSGGMTLDQIRLIDRLLYSVSTEQQNRLPWADLPGESSHRGFALLISYNVLRGTKYDCFKGRFGDNHAMWINHRNADGSWHGCDPGADGRPDGKGGHVPLGYMDYPDDLLRRAAGALHTSTTSPAVLGIGYAQVLFSRPDPVAVTPQPHVVLTAPTPPERNAMIAPAYGLATTQRMALAKGQPAFRYPGGPRVTAMSVAATVPYVGKAGSGWVAVVIGTGVPYVDKQVRPTILYVPAAAGPIS